MYHIYTRIPSCSIWSFLPFRSSVITTSIARGHCFLRLPCTSPAKFLLSNTLSLAGFSATPHLSVNAKIAASARSLTAAGRPQSDAHTYPAP